MNRKDLQQVQAFRRIQGINQAIQGDVTLMESTPDTKTDLLSNLTIRLRRLLKKRIAEDAVNTSDN